MSDTFILCPKCGEEVAKGSFVLTDSCWYCKNCTKWFEDKDVRIVTAEYFKEGEDEKDNRSSRS